MGYVEVHFESMFWSCECCGSGHDQRVTWEVDGEGFRYSRDDQFGGPINKDHDLELPYDGEAFAEGVVAALKSVGYHAVIIKEGS